MENEQLLQYVERIEHINTAIGELQAQIREVFAEAKGNGFSAKGIREVIKLRKMNPADRSEEEFLREKYKELLGLN